MFTGFIKETGIINEVNIIEAGAELTIKVSSHFASEILLQSNIAIDGSVLTVLEKKDFPNLSYLKFYASNFRKVASYTSRKRVNLERAIRLGEEIPGAFFFGVPTTQVKIISLNLLSEGKLMMQVSLKDDLINYLSVKDQVCLDGVLLQIKTISGFEIGFELYATTLSLTNLGERKVGDLLRIEVEPFTLKISQILQKFDFKDCLKAIKSL